MLTTHSKFDYIEITTYSTATNRNNYFKLFDINF